jgi:hypothetical protein
MMIPVVFNKTAGPHGTGFVRYTHEDAQSFSDVPFLLISLVLRQIITRLLSSWV